MMGLRSEMRLTLFRNTKMLYVPVFLESYRLNWAFNDAIETTCCEFLLSNMCCDDRRERLELIQI